MNSLRAASGSIEEIPDNRIETAIDDQLWSAKGVNANGIDIRVTDGTVKLSGEVKSILAKETAVRIAEMTKGVRSVIDNMEVPLSDRSDERIRADVQSALKMDPATDSWEIDIQVLAGTVTLTGSVDSQAERELAGKVAKSVAGVRALNNDIELDYDSTRGDFEIRQDIEQRLNWDVRLDDEMIAVETKNGEVTLTGTVGSAYEKRLAYGDAWVAGVKSVNDDDLEVKWWSRDDMQRKNAWKNLTNEQIRKAIFDAFLYDPRVNSFEPTVTVYDGVVTLGGVVDNLKSKRAAAQDAKNTVGVTHVNNHIRVRPASSLSDEALEEDISSALVRDPIVNRFDVTVSVIDGEAYLYGDIDSYFEKTQAEDVVSRVNGVTNVNNYLKVSYEPISGYDQGYYDWDATLYDYDFDYETTRYKPDADIERDIESELWWSPWVDSDQVKVTVDSGKATLKGTVDSWSERELAEENALEGGAIKVVNKLDVRY